MTKKDNKGEIASRMTFADVIPSFLQVTFTGACGFRDEFQSDGGFRLITPLVNAILYA